MLFVMSTWNYVLDVVCLKFGFVPKKVSMHNVYVMKANVSLVPELPGRYRPCQVGSICTLYCVLIGLS